jgi:hypothetical protein
MDLREIGWGGMDWINVAEDRDQWRGSCEHGNELSDSIKCWEILAAQLVDSEEGLSSVNTNAVGIHADSC